MSNFNIVTEETSEPAEVVEESPEEPETMEQIQAAPESIPVTSTEEPKGDENADVEEITSDTSPSSDEVKKEESAPAPETVEASSKLGKIFPTHHHTLQKVVLF